jgi:D-alanyl-D-alanine carboxypeptidase
MNSFGTQIHTRLAAMRAVARTVGVAAIAASAVLALALIAPAASATSRTAVSPESQLQRALDQVVAAGVPGAVVLARQGNHTTLLASGYGNLKQKTRLRTSDRFRVGSVTKTFVATVVLQLVAEGKLNLDETVEHRLPGVIPNGDAITLRQLLNMTSGLFDYLNDGDTTVDDRLLAGDLTYRWSPLELIAISNKHDPRFAPGAGWEYCSTCYVLLGLIVEKTTRHTLAAEMKRRIFAPAGLKSTSFDTEPRIRGHYAHGYELLGKPPLADVSILSPSHGWAAGALVSNAPDLARFYRALYRGQLLKPALVKQMLTTVPMAPKVISSGYGLGLFKLPMRCGTAFGHPGAIPGFLADAWSSKDGNRQAVLLINIGEHSRTATASAAARHALETAYCLDITGRR